MKSDFLVTEFGGARFPMGKGAKLPIMTAEKGSQWTRLRVKGTPGHGSMPYQSDNALVKASEVITRVAGTRPAAASGGAVARFVEGIDLGSGRAHGPRRIRRRSTWRSTGARGTQPMLYARDAPTFSPNIAHGGVKVNVIPDSARSTSTSARSPATTAKGAPDARDAVGDLWKDVEVAFEGSNPASASPIDTPLWDALTRVTAAADP